jgi:hypothetical protein
MGASWRTGASWRKGASWRMGVASRRREGVNRRTGKECNAEVVVLAEPKMTGGKM